jgi:hypothetical protein
VLVLMNLMEKPKSSIYEARAQWQRQVVKFWFLGEYGSALYAAGHDQIIQRLLEKGADVNAQCGYYGSALQTASCEGHDQIVRRPLVQYDVEVYLMPISLFQRRDLLLVPDAPQGFPKLSNF